MKKIAISELRLGMYVSKLGGSWLKHPFWKGSFLLRDPKDLAAILASGIQEVDLARQGAVGARANP